MALILTSHREYCSALQPTATLLTAAPCAIGKKLFILTKPHLATLNIRKKLVTVCRHVAKYSLKKLLLDYFNTILSDLSRL